MQGDTRAAIRVAAVLAFVVGACGPQRPAPVVPAPEPEPVAEEPPTNVKATYRLSVPFGPCGELVKKFIKEGDGFTVLSDCPSVPSYPGAYQVITEEEFNMVVYVQAALADPAYEYAEVPVTEVDGAPAGTARCYRTPEQAHTVCENEAGVVTYTAFDGTKLDPPKLDANRSLTLDSYEAD